MPLPLSFVGATGTGLEVSGSVWPWLLGPTQPIAEVGVTLCLLLCQGRAPLSERLPSQSLGRVRKCTWLAGCRAIAAATMPLHFVWILPA